MNRIGMSSSCFYPLELEESFLRLAKSGLKAAEIFINAESEFVPEYVKKLIKIKEEYSIDLISVHPYTSFAENTMLFSSYKRRFYDFLEVLDIHFNAAAMLGAKYYVIHGIRENGSIDNREYYERFAEIIKRGKTHGILPIQENVVNLRSQSPEFLFSMRNYIGESFKMVLDIKQARRAEVSPYEFINLLADDIVHVHISDYSESSDCILPLRGKFEFEQFFTLLNEKGYKGDYLIELYNSGYSSIEEIIESANSLQEILDVKKL